MVLALIVGVAVAVGVFLFVKNNPKKTAQIDQAAKSVADKIQNQAKKL